jgi:hypothetical protein
MKKDELERKTEAVATATREALQTVRDALNNGQQKKLLKNEAVAALFERYGVITED